LQSDEPVTLAYLLNLSKEAKGEAKQDQAAAAVSPSGSARASGSGDRTFAITNFP
jgi:hypothetical protein